MTVIHTDTDREYWSRDYWLGHCEGFRMEDDTGSLGIVEEVLGDEDDPDELLVRGGLFANRLYRIRVEAIEEIEPRVQRIVVRMDREPAR